MTDRETAQHVCTPGELEAWQLRKRGLSQRAIALALNLSRSAVRARLENADRKIDLARKDNAA